MADDIDARLFALETAFRVLARELDDRNLVSLGQLGDALALEAQRVRDNGTNVRALETTPLPTTANRRPSTTIAVSSSTTVPSTCGFCATASRADFANGVYLFLYLRTVPENPHER